MRNKNLKILLGMIAAISVIPLLLSAPLSSDNDESGNADGGYVLFPNAYSDEYIEINHHFNGISTVGDAAKDDGFFIITDTYVDTASCEFCIRVQYTPGENGVAGFSYLDQDGFDLTNAKRVTFLAMGVSGDAEVKFMVGGKESPAQGNGQGVFKNQKFLKTTQSMKLDNDWQFIEVDIRNGNLKNITHPFAVEINPAEDSGQIVFYIKNIYVDTQEPKKPIATE